MRPADNVNELIKKLQLKASAELDKKVHDDISAALAEPEKIKSVHAEPNIWRTIMKSRKIQLATAATVILIVSLICYWSNTSIVTKAYAISDMPELLYSARNLHMKKIDRLSFNFSSSSSSGGQSVSGRRGFNGGASGVDRKSSIVEVDTEYWLDLDNGRWRTPFLGFSSGGGIGPGGPETSQPKVSVAERICDGGEFEILLDHDRKTASYTRLNEFRKKLRCHQYAKIFLKEVLGEPDWYDSYQIIGQEEIDGKTYDIWQAVMEKQLKHAFKENNWLPPEAAEFAYVPARKKQVWLSPDTGEFAKTIEWTQSNGQWHKGSETTLVEHNIDMPDEIFALEPPPGYRPLNSKYSATESELGQGRGSILSIWLSTHIGFALPDGSVIACWSSHDDKSQAPQDPLFENLEMGGPLPKLPFEVYALEATHKDVELTFEGYHLAYTKKNGEFYEWALYIPSQDIDPKYSQMLNYNFIFRNNTPRKVDVNSLGTSVRAELTIENQQDCETFVLGAMAELSDEGLIPEHLSYENILRLVDELRDSSRN
jgi:hypothetical protein